MTAPHPRTLAGARVAWEDGVPVAPDYGDVYFSRRDGVAESQAVFLAGNALPDRWRNGPFRFCIAETGFGSGLNFLLARDAFLDHAGAGSVLHFVSVERHPMDPADRERLALRLQADHPRLAAGLRALAKCEPPRLRGWHRRVFDGGRVRLSLWLGEAGDGFRDWAEAGGHGADAWFLDGFAPGRNPELWAPELLALLPRLSRPGATVGTFSVAGSVRRALADAGFDVDRVPGPLGKRQVLRGRLRDGLGHDGSPMLRRARVLGAGLAGACVAAALAERGLEVRVSDPAGIASGASANPWAVLHPRLPLDDGPRGPWLATAYAFSRHLLHSVAGDCWQPRPVVQLPEVRRPDRLARVAERYRPSGDWLQPERFTGLDCIRFPDAGWAELPALVRRLLGQPRISIDSAAADGPVTPEPGELVVVAAGAASAGLLPVAAPLGRMRGQLTRTRDAMPDSAPNWPILTGRGHAIALADGWVCGASYVRDGPADGVSAEERAQNLERLAVLQRLLGAARSAGRVTTEFVGVRCTVPDRLPLVGQVADAGSWVSTGHASAGLLGCPLAAEAIAAAACGEPPVLDGELRALLTPDRFT